MIFKIKLDNMEATRKSSAKYLENIKNMTVVKLKVRESMEMLPKELEVLMTPKTQNNSIKVSRKSKKIRILQTKIT
jgi:hypothetical protein